MRIRIILLEVDDMGSPTVPEFLHRCYCRQEANDKNEFV